MSSKKKLKKRSLFLERMTVIADSQNPKSLQSRLKEKYKNHSLNEFLCLNYKMK